MDHAEENLRLNDQSDSQSKVVEDIEAQNGSEVEFRHSHFLFVARVIIFLFAVAFVVTNFVLTLVFSMDSRNLISYLTIMIFLITVGAFVGVWVGAWPARRLIDELKSTRTELEQLRREKNIMMQAREQQSSAGGSMPGNNASEKDMQKEDANAVSTPVEDQRLSYLDQPRPSIYDKEVDPPGYEKEKAVHPHHKLYPARLEDMERKSVLPYGWRIIGASRRGYGHAYQGKYREDDFAIKFFRISLREGQPPAVHMALIAIADGVSAKEYSRYGALAAVQGAIDVVQWSKELVEEGRMDPSETPHSLLWTLAELLWAGGHEEQCKDKAHDLLMQMMRAAMMSVNRRAQQQKGLSSDDLHSTLMLFLVVPLGQRRLFVASTQVGDGVLFALQANNSTKPRDRWQWIQHAQIQASGNEVQPFMRSKPEQWNEVFQCEVLENVHFVMGMTDGTADDIEPPRPTADDQDPDPFFYVDDFYQRIRRDSIEKANPAQALDDFLGYKRKQSYDDRTVVCLYNEHQL